MLIFKRGVFMAVKGRGGGKTPEMVVQILTEKVAEFGQSVVARETGLTRLTIRRYLKGIGEPSKDTLRKLAGYFDVLWDFTR
jgi:DNA-binding phage protein